MKQLLAWMAAALLTLVAAATAAHAGCDPLTGVRSPMLPITATDYCLNRAGDQTDAGDNFGAECDYDVDQTCTWGVKDFVVIFQPAFSYCAPHPNYNPAADWNQDNCVGAPDFLSLGMEFDHPSYYPDYPN